MSKSGIFLNNNINSLFDSATESNTKLPSWISIVDNANNTELSASSTMNNMVGGSVGGSFSATSTMNNMVGGSYSATSTVNNMFGGSKGGSFSAASSEKDVNKLISMLTSESSVNNNAMSETSTVSLENQLRDILNQNGGSKKSHKQSGGSNVNVNDVKSFFTSLKSQGVNVDVKLNNKTMSDFFGMAEETTTELGSVHMAAAESSTSDVALSELVGGKAARKGKKASKKSSKKASKKSSKKASKKASKKSSKKGSKKGSKKSSKKGSKSSQDGGDNPGFRAFLDLKKHIATKLGVSNSPKVGKVAGAVQKDMKEKHPGKGAVEIAKLGMEHFDKNMEHYKQMLPK